MLRQFQILNFKFQIHLLVVLALPVVVFASMSSDSPFNVDFFFGWGNYYRPMEWTPVEIGITSTLTEPFAGSVTISAQQDGLNTLDIVHTFVLTPDVPLHLPLVTKLAFTADKCGVRLRDERGRTRWDYDFNLWNVSLTHLKNTRNRLLTVVHENDLLIGLVGRGKFGLSRLPQRSICQSQRGRGKVYLGDKLPRMVPWDWTGFVSLDLLILYDPDWNLFNQHQLNAIAQWVSNGGKLLLVLGSHPLSAKNPIAQLLPFELQNVKQITVPPETLEKFGLFSNVSKTPRRTETVTCWPLVSKPVRPTAGLIRADFVRRFYETESYNAGESLFGTGYTGFGRVGVLAFDPSTMTDKQRANSARFWVGRITAILEDAHTAPVSPKDSLRRTKRPILPRDNRGRNPWVSSRSGRYAMTSSRSIRFVENAEGSVDKSRSQQPQRQYEVGQAQAANNAVMEYLYNISEMRPLSIWWVILLLITLAVLLGPVDYKMLKRRGRLPLTWLTCAFWITLFTVGAYYGVQALRGGKMQLRVVSVLDGIEGSNQTWSTDYCGLFAPHSDDYEFKGLKDNQWWSGIAPTQQSIWAYNREVGGRKIYCFQHDGGNLPYSLPINIWTIQCLLNESPLEQLPFNAQVERNADEVIVNIVNDSDAPILNGYALFGNDRGINFGSVPARAGKQFRSRLRPMRLWGDYNPQRYREYYYRQRNYSANFNNEDAFFAQGCLQRTQTIGAYLARGAAMVCVQYDKAPVSFAVEGRSCSYDHIQLARLVVFPQEQKKETPK